MHPFVETRSRLALYLGASVALVAAVGVLIVDGRGYTNTAIFVLPLALLQSVLGLSAWYPCRAAPIGGRSASAIILTHTAGAAVAAGIWTGAATAHARFLERVRPGFSPITERQLATWFALGMLFYLLAVAVHYAVIAFERSMENERRTLALEITAREAELRALRSQVDPHFLFNSLNSIASMCGSDANAAREMAALLADFFRETLRAGGREAISVQEEVDLAAKYLAVERQRFGDRLRFHPRVAPEIAGALVPPLLIQPLVENAVRHGIAHRVEGGTVEIEALRRQGTLCIRVTNEADADRPALRGENLGLRNVSDRLRARYGREARLDISEAEGIFSAEVSIPLSGEAS
jgi:two-component system, LytTR family, sensor histidine kinase AlgZ